MIEMSDVEFIERIKARLREKGWRTGAIGTADGPNCLLGAAGFVAHNGDLIVENGITPVAVDGKTITPDERDNDPYEHVPGMVRLARLLGFEKAWNVVTFNDYSGSLAEVLDKVDDKLATTNV